MRPGAMRPDATRPQPPQPPPPPLGPADMGRWESDITFEEAITVPAAIRSRFLHRGHAGDVAALTLTESLGGLTLYHKAHAQLHHAALAHLALCERAHRV